MPPDLLGYLWNGILTFVVGVVGWFAGDVLKQQRALQRQLHEHKLETAEKFATKDDLLRSQNDVQRRLDKIEDALEKLNDKFDRLVERFPR